MSAFVLITSFALGILSSILALQRFNPEEFNKKAVLNNSSEIISYDKHCDGINMEFIDDKGIYRIYKSFFDGGHVNYKEVEK